MLKKKEMQELVTTLLNEVKGHLDNQEPEHIVSTQ